MKFLLICFFTLSAVFVRSQVSDVDVFLESNKKLETAVEYDIAFTIKVEDARNISENKMNLDVFNGYLEDAMEESLEDDLDVELDYHSLPANLVLPEIALKISFFNFTESSSGDVILKGMSDITANGGSFYDFNESFVTSGEFFSDLSYRAVKRGRRADEFSLIEERFSGEYARKVNNKLNELLKNKKSNIFKVVSLGDAKGTGEKAEAKAVLNALVKATEMAFGTKVTNVSEVVDFGDVKDVIKTNTGGLVLWRKVIKELKTEDHYYALVESIIVKENEK